MGRLVRSVLAHGWSAFNVEYRRLGRFGGGGGWPNTFDDARDAIDAIAVHQRNASADADQCGPIIVVGHSAGGHLALWAAAHTAARVAGVVALAAPSDLETLSREGSEPVDRLVAGATIDDRWRSTSPRRMLPLGVPIACIHGEHDATIDPAMSAAFVGAARAAGDDAEFRLIAGERHRDALRPTSRTWAAALRFVEGWTSERSPSGVHSSC